jgi:hypothetical protein
MLNAGRSRLDDGLMVFIMAGLVPAIHVLLF